LPFFVFGVSRLFLPCFGLSRGLACRGRFGLFICSPWLGLAGSRLACLSRVCGGCLHPVASCRLSVLSVLSVCLCVSVSVAGSHPVGRGVCFELSRCACIPVRLSNRCSIRALEQVFRTNFRRSFIAVSQNFQPNPDRIFGISARVQPNPDRIEPNIG
jgi:hypothetical protein